MEDNQEQQTQIDEITGLPTVDQQFDDTVNKLNTVLQQCENFKLLKCTKGWAQVEDFIQGQTKELTTQLKFEENFDKIKRLQALIVAFESILNIIELSFLESEKARIELDKLIGPEN